MSSIDEMTGSPAELTASEHADRQHFEAEYDALAAAAEETSLGRGRVLRPLRGRRLFKSTHRSWTAYCEDRLRISKRQADRLIWFATLADELGPRGPVSEKQARPLGGLSPGRRVEVVARVEAEGGFGAVSARRVEEAAREVEAGGVIEPRTPPLVVVAGGAVTLGRAGILRHLEEMDRHACAIFSLGPHAVPTAVEALDDAEAQRVAEQLGHIFRLVSRFEEFMVAPLAPDEGPPQERWALPT